MTRAPGPAPMARSLKRIALIVAVATALSKLAGLLRQQVIAASTRAPSGRDWRASTLTMAL